jgi:hypothetical protein
LALGLMLLLLLLLITAPKGKLVVVEGGEVTGVHAGFETIPEEYAPVGAPGPYEVVVPKYPPDGF